MIAPLPRRLTGVAWMCTALFALAVTSADELTTLGSRSPSGAGAALAKRTPSPRDRAVVYRAASASRPQPAVAERDAGRAEPKERFTVALQTRGAAPWRLAYQCISGDYYSEIRRCIPPRPSDESWGLPPDRPAVHLMLGGAEEALGYAPLVAEDPLPNAIDVARLGVQAMNPVPPPLPTLRDSTSQ